MTGNIVLRMRSIGRVLGLNRLLGRLINSDYYEERFGKEMLGRAQSGDVVWDVGANVGLYTEEFLNRVGDTGKVYAFEPAPGSVRALINRFEKHANVSILSYALGDSNGEVEMLFDEKDPTSVINKIVTTGDGEKGDMIRIRTADSVVDSEEAPLPNVIKIDVEGHELSVIKGMRSILSSNSLKCIAIEVHFKLLSDRGEEFAPKEIENILLSHDFSIKWTDPSHIVAFRK